MTFHYWSNKTKAHEELLAQIEAKDIAEADKVFRDKTGMNPSKTPWVGCIVVAG